MPRFEARKNLLNTNKANDAKVLSAVEATLKALKTKAEQLTNTAKGSALSAIRKKKIEDSLIDFERIIDRLLNEVAIRSLDYAVSDGETLQLYMLTL